MARNSHQSRCRLNVLRLCDEREEGDLARLLVVPMEMDMGGIATFLVEAVAEPLDRWLARRSGSAFAVPFLRDASGRQFGERLDGALQNQPGTP